MRYDQLLQTLVGEFREYTLSPATSVALDIEMPSVLDAEPELKIRWMFCGDHSRYLNVQDLAPAEIVKLADIKGMVNDWKSGKLADLLPSTSTRFANFRAYLRRRVESEDKQ